MYVHLPLTLLYTMMPHLMQNFVNLPLVRILHCLPLLPSPQHLDVEADSKSLKGQLLGVCPALEKLPSMDGLLGVWAGVRVRMFMHYQLSARAYFTFLKLSGSQAGSSPALDDMNVTASLRLLRLLVKYAVELKSELEKGFATTPTKPWKGV